MAVIDVSAYVDVLRVEGTRLVNAAEAAGPDAPVPSCPEWVVRDLLRHLGGVHRWATSFVAEARTEPVGMDEVVGPWPTDATLVEWFREGHATLVDALAGASPDLECWTFLEAPSPLAMWARRQAHETAIHRVDAELAAGTTLSPLPAAFSADGIDELLISFIPRRGGELAADPAASLRVRCEDADADWLVRFGAGSLTTTRAGGVGDCEVHGNAGDLYLALWHRGPADGWAFEGDAGVLQRFLDGMRVP